ncbi:hypothetical protein [Bacillus mycoides]|uniref:Uncharacterized protein n=1 Tax=Bacillus mycoides (strain KBAB4) TaxID=315730 RepID=A9VUU7_BACMK|nr:hypothetical protein [Bacillus mycoides]ABY46668.1 hypothetical protein BcerKBAB4_5713 [Bacillus mycoides KBAB4]
MNRLATEELGPVEGSVLDAVPDVVVPHVSGFLVRGIIHCITLKTKEDFLNTNKHLLTRVDFHIFEIADSERYINRVTNN